MTRRERGAQCVDRPSSTLSDRRAAEASSSAVSRESKGTLFVVGTPIGHLEDITLRALRILKSVALVAAEDTRRTGNLLRHYDIHTPLLSVHEHNEHVRAQRLVERLMAGESVALVSDAGTPGVSDPGATVVAAARRAGIRVEPIPGASAVVTAMSAAGFDSEGFCFVGFAPIKAKARRLWFDGVAAEAKSRAVVFFEAPHRLHRTLDELGLLVKRPIFATRELTKIHEELIVGTAAELKRVFESPQGEFTLVIPPENADDTLVEEPTDEDIRSVFGQITVNGGFGSKREAARAVAERLGLSTRRVYAVLESAK